MGLFLSSSFSYLFLRYWRVKVFNIEHDEFIMLFIFSAFELIGNSCVFSLTAIVH